MREVGERSKDGGLLQRSEVDGGGGIEVRELPYLASALRAVRHKNSIRLRQQRELQEND